MKNIIIIGISIILINIPLKPINIKISNQNTKEFHNFLTYQEEFHAELQIKLLQTTITESNVIEETKKIIQNNKKLKSILTQFSNEYNHNIASDKTFISNLLCELYTPHTEYILNLNAIIKHKEDAACIEEYRILKNKEELSKENYLDEHAEKKITKIWQSMYQKTENPSFQNLIFVLKNHYLKDHTEIESKFYNFNIIYYTIETKILPQIKMIIPLIISGYLGKIFFEKYIIPKMKLYYSFQPTKITENYTYIPQVLERQFIKTTSIIKKMQKDKTLKPIPGIVLYGQPATGKTIFAYALAKKTDSPLFIIQSTELMNEAGVLDIKQLFERLDHAHQYAAWSKKPVICFIDEADLIFPGARLPNTSMNPQEKAIFREMLTRFNDDNKKQNGVLIILASNMHDYFDCALTRPGRISDVVTASINTKDQIEFFKIFSEKLSITIEKNLDIEKILETNLKTINITSIKSFIDEFMIFLQANQLEKIFNDKNYNLFLNKNNQ